MKILCTHSWKMLSFKEKQCTKCGRQSCRTPYINGLLKMIKMNSQAKLAQEMALGRAGR